MIVLAALIIWFACDFFFFSVLNTDPLDCLGGEGVSRKSRGFEMLVCSPLLVGQGWVGWAFLLWTFGPLVALWLWLKRGR
jgi:hypothetical protein